jgi:hypothetical protein
MRFLSLVHSTNRQVTQVGENRARSSICFLDLSRNVFQLCSEVFQVELDEVYRMQSLVLL